MLVLMNVKNIPSWNIVSDVQKNAGIVQKDAVRWHKSNVFNLFHAKAQSLLRRKDFFASCSFLAFLREILREEIRCQRKSEQSFLINTTKNRALNH